MKCVYIYIYRRHKKEVIDGSSLTLPIVAMVLTGGIKRNIQAVQEVPDTGGSAASAPPPPEPIVLRDQGRCIERERTPVNFLKKLYAKGKISAKLFGEGAECLGKVTRRRKTRTQVKLTIN